MPSGLGMHACMLGWCLVSCAPYGRCHIVQLFSLQCFLLEWDGPVNVHLEGFHERIMATAAVYNMPLPEQKKKVRFKIEEKMTVPLWTMRSIESPVLETGNQYQNW